jgi:hypothetical protein
MMPPHLPTVSAVLTDQPAGITTIIWTVTIAAARGCS